MDSTLIRLLLAFGDKRKPTPPIEALQEFLWQMTLQVGIGLHDGIGECHRGDRNDAPGWLQYPGRGLSHILRALQASP